MTEKRKPEIGPVVMWTGADAETVISNRGELEQELWGRPLSRWQRFKRWWVQMWRRAVRRGI